MTSTNSILIAAVAFTLSAPFSHAGSWEAEKSDNRRTLAYSTKAPLAGQETGYVVTFNCDTTSEPEVHGTLGFDIGIEGVAKVAGFPFTDFEGPDAVDSPAVEATITRSGKEPLKFSADASGSFSDEDTFTFGVSELSKKSKSAPREVLEALAKPDAEMLRLVVSDPRPAGKSLEFLIPVTGRHEEFQELIEDLK